MLEGNEEVIKLPAMPKRPPPAAYNYYIDGHETGQSMAVVMKMFKDLPSDKKEPYISKYKKALEQYKLDLLEWSAAAEKAGYVENVQYQPKDIVAALDKFHINVDIKSCSELMGKLAGHWVVQTLKKVQESNADDKKFSKHMMDYLNDEKLMRHSSYYASTLACLHRVKPTDYIKQINEIDDLVKVRPEESSEKVKNTRQLNKDYKSNKLNAILKE